MENYIIVAQPLYDIILLDAKIGIKLESDILQEYFPLGVKPLFIKKKIKIKAKPACLSLCPVAQGEHKSCLVSLSLWDVAVNVNQAHDALGNT